VVPSSATVDVARKRVSYAEHIAIANDSQVKYEYIAGEIVAMSGGTIALVVDESYVDRIGPIV
jgi:hypothetical protein